MTSGRKRGVCWNWAATADDVRAETRRLLELGRDGGYIFAPAHDVEGDVPLDNILAFVDILHQQPGYVARITARRRR